MDAGRNDLPSYIPGFLSLDSWFGSPGTGSQVLSADCSYRQEIAWSPHNDSLHLVTARLTLTPDYRKLLGYEEGSFDTRFEVQRVIRRLTLGAAVDFLSVTHDDTVRRAATSTLYDRRLEVTQKFMTTKKTSVSLLEVVGLAHQSDSSSPGATSLRQHILLPAFAVVHLPADAQGDDRAQYTWSVVPFSGDDDYRIARGFQGGVSNQVIITSDIKVGKRFLINGTYRLDTPGAGNIRGSEQRFFAGSARGYVAWVREEAILF